MGYRIKIKAIPPQGKAEKFAFELPEGVRFQISGKTPGMRIFSQFFSNPETILCEMVVDDGQLLLIAPPRPTAGGPPPPTALLNGNLFEEEKLKPNDIAHVGNGRIEFIEVPVKQTEVEPDSAEASTRFVNFNESAKGADRTPEKDYEKTPPRPTAEELVGLHAARNPAESKTSTEATTTPEDLLRRSTLPPEIEHQREKVQEAEPAKPAPAELASPLKREESPAEPAQPPANDFGDSPTAMIMRLNAQDASKVPAKETIKPATLSSSNQASSQASQQAVAPRAFQKKNETKSSDSFAWNQKTPPPPDTKEASTRIVSFNESEKIAPPVEKPTHATLSVPKKSEEAESPTEMIMKMSVSNKKTSKNTKEAAGEFVENATRQVQLGDDSQNTGEGATSMIMNMKVPQSLPSSLKKAGAVSSLGAPVQVKGIGQRKDLFTRVQSLLSEDGPFPPFAAKPLSKLFQPLLNVTASIRSNASYPRFESIALSWFTIGAIGEVFSWIAFGSKFAFDPIPSPFNALIAIGTTTALSWFMSLVNPGEEGENAPEKYLRSFAWFSFSLIPFGLSFYFPKSVIIMAFIFMAITWMFYFGRKYFSESEYFLQYSSVSWIGIMVVSLRVVSSMHFESPIHAPIAVTPPQAARDLASAPPPNQLPVAQQPAANTLSAQSAPQQVAQATAPNNNQPQSGQIPTQVVGSLANQAPATAPMNKEQIAREANSLALDPMASEQFFNAIKSGNLKLVKSLVDNHIVDPTFTLEHGSSALHFAAAQGDLALVKYLISKKVSIDAKDAGGTTPLMWAVYHKHTNVVDFLLFKKADPNIRREGGDRALEIAKRTRDDEIIEMVENAMSAADKAPKRSLATSTSSKKSALSKRRKPNPANED